MSDEPFNSPFSYVVSDDKTKLKIDLNEGEFVYSVEQVARLAMFFANLRGGMLPAPHDTSGADPVNIACDRYEVFQNPQDGSAQIYMRIPGFGWSYSHLSKVECLRLAETLNPAAPPIDTPKH